MHNKTLRDTPATWWSSSSVWFLFFYFWNRFNLHSIDINLVIRVYGSRVCPGFGTSSTVMAVINIQSFDQLFFFWLQGGDLLA